MMVQRRVITCFLFLSLLFSSCQKGSSEKDEGFPIPENPMPEIPQQSSERCRLIRVTDEAFARNNGSYIREYIYDTNKRLVRINNLNANNYLTSYLEYTYTPKGKAAEELNFNPAGNLIKKRVFTYDANNLLSRIEFYDLVSGVLTLIPDNITFQYNTAGQRIRTNRFSSYQPDKTYLTYSYNNSKPVRISCTYFMDNNPPKQMAFYSFDYDTLQSPYYALGYLDDFYPDYEKHNLVGAFIMYSGSGGGHFESYRYQYDSLGLPIEGIYKFDNVQNYKIKFEYDCN